VLEADEERRKELRMEVREKEVRSVGKEGWRMVMVVVGVAVCGDVVMIVVYVKRNVVMC